MIFRTLADLVVAGHFAFILFVALGGLLVLIRPRLAWAHLPAAIWGVAIELAGWYCPLTPLENWLRARGGESAYPGGFVEHYILPLVYPDSLTRRLQITLGVAVLAVNVAVYAIAGARRWRRRA